MNQNNNSDRDEESSSDQSSCWDDWQDADYIEEQRKALQEFSKKQKAIKSAHGKKKKKKGKKKKRGQNAGDALEFDVESEGYSQIHKGEIAGDDMDNGSMEGEDGDRAKLEEYKQANMSKTRLAADEASYAGASNFDVASMEANEDLDNIKGLVGGVGLPNDMFRSNGTEESGLYSSPQNPRKQLLGNKKDPQEN